MKKENYLFAFYCSIIPLIYLITLFFQIYKCNLNPLMLGFFFVYLITVTYSIIYYGIFSLYTLYLYMSAFFLYDAFFMTLFFEQDFLLQVWPVRYRFSEEVGFIFITSCYITVYINHIVYCWARNKIKTPSIGKQVSVKNWWKIGLSLFLLSIIPVCYKIIIQLQFVRKYGFAATYSPAFDKIKYPFWCSGAFLLFYAGYYIILASKPTKKQFIICSVIYVILSVLNAMKGSRAAAVVPIIVVLYLYQVMYNKVISVKKLFFIFVILVSLIIYISNVRSSYNSKETEKSSSKVSEIIEELFWYQTQSRMVPMLIIQGDLKYHPYPFVITPIIYAFHGYRKDSDPIFEHNDPSSVLMANLSLTMARNGKGYGSAFIGEAYECGGYIGIFFWAILFSLLLAYLDSYKFRQRNIFIPIIFVLTKTIPVSPRKEIFSIFRWDLNPLIITYFVLFFISFLFPTLNRKKKEAIENGKL